MTSNGAIKQGVEEEFVGSACLGAEVDSEADQDDFASSYGDGDESAPALYSLLTYEETSKKWVVEGVTRYHPTLPRLECGAVHEHGGCVVWHSIGNGMVGVEENLQQAAGREEV